MRETLLYSLLELANATSQNLGFAHRDNVHVSYGEETITETNLLELRRRHPTKIRLSTFGKKQESLNGADWEWHIIGQVRNLRMRVQAKRLQKNDTLKIPHSVASSGNKQIDVLIADAAAYRLKPVYCIYSSEIQRTIWQTASPSGRSGEFEYGCLLASAHKVKAIMPKTLKAIEADCVPWHYLVDRQRYSEQKFAERMGETTSFLQARRTPVERSIDDRDLSHAEFPTIDELNAIDGPTITLEGVVERRIIDEERPMSASVYRERGIGRLLEVDVQDIPPRRRPDG